jgi:uncharacterized Fe-S cluster-containing radical SAM superfamily protein
MRDDLPEAVPKFTDPLVTATGAPRARVRLSRPRTLWFNTGTLCNITCDNCYIESSPTNDRLAYITRDEVADFLAQIADRGWPVTEIGFTGGEPFMNPEMIGMAEAALAAGYRVLILTNAMLPMMRPMMQDGIARLNAAHPGQMTLRVSLDHYRALRHDDLRGMGSFRASMKGMRWLRDQGVPMTVAGRTVWGETEAEARAGFAALFAREELPIDAADPGQTVLFPEMDETADVPEISEACWGILGKSPDTVMCATSRMVVKRRGTARPVIVSCTLQAYNPQFELGATLAEAEGEVTLNHPHCARFCVLGGATCSG